MMPSRRRPLSGLLLIDAATPLLEAAGWRPRRTPATERAKLVGCAVFEARA
jgi:hypothetical protein